MEPSITSPSSASSFLCSLEAASLVSEAVVLFSCFEVGEAAGENAKKVQRYIWLSRLSEELLAMVDSKKLGFSQGVDISFLTEEAQQWVQAVIEEKSCNSRIIAGNSKAKEPEDEMEALLGDSGVFG